MAFLSRDGQARRDSTATHPIPLQDTSRNNVIRIKTKMVTGELRRCPKITFTSYGQSRKNASHTQIWRKPIWLRRRAIGFVNLVLRGYARIGFRQGYADSAESSANPGKNVLWRNAPSDSEGNPTEGRFAKQSRKRPRHASFAKFCVCEASAFQAGKQRVK